MWKVVVQELFRCRLFREYTRIFRSFAPQTEVLLISTGPRVALHDGSVSD